MPPPPSKRRRVADTGRVRVKGPRPEELTFDFAQRQEYLTGFHKRKQARIKHAQEVAAAKEREEKIRDRKELRQKRKTELEEHVKAISGALKDSEANAQLVEDGEDSNEEWTGVTDDEEGDFEGAAPAVRPIDHEDEYVDEDKYTTVTVEEVGISRHGFDRTDDTSEDDSEGHVQHNRTVDAGRPTAKAQPSRSITRQEEREGKIKKRRKKFKYETKADRKVTKAKERAKNSRAAKTRKGK